MADLLEDGQGNTLLWNDTVVDGVGARIAVRTRRTTPTTDYGRLKGRIDEDLRSTTVGYLEVGS